MDALNRSDFISQLTGDVFLSQHEAELQLSADAAPR
jgi:hypothetical protein